MTDALKVAGWMLRELDREEALYQDVVAFEIKSRFGEEHVYINRNGNLAISKEVLSEFRKLTGMSVVWVRGERYWRRRDDHDHPNSRTVS